MVDDHVESGGGGLLASRLLTVARDQFGWNELRREQLVAMMAVMAGRDTFVVAPTGAGKSAIYWSWIESDYDIPGTGR